MEFGGYRDNPKLLADHAAEVERMNAIVRDLQAAMESTNPIQAANNRVFEYHQLKGEVGRLTAEIRVQRDEIEILTTVRDGWQEKFRAAENVVSKLTAERDAAVAKAERAEEALRFYADKKNWRVTGKTVNPIEKDMGKQARAALAAAPDNISQAGKKVELVPVYPGPGLQRGDIVYTPDGKRAEVYNFSDSGTLTNLGHFCASVLRR
jgi:chromosome segregation ATPase